MDHFVNSASKRYGLCNQTSLVLHIHLGNISSANQPLRANQLWGRGGRGNLQKQGRGGRGDLQKCDYLHFCKSPLPPLPRSWFAQFARRGWFALDTLPLEKWLVSRILLPLNKYHFVYFDQPSDKSSREHSNPSLSPLIPW